MDNGNRFSRHWRDNYNDDWDRHADRDRYERDYYQNRRYRPQGHSYEHERDQYGGADYNRFGTGYTGNNYNRYPDDTSYNTRMERRYQNEGSWRNEARGARRDRSFYDRRQQDTHYGYPETPRAENFDADRDHDYFRWNDREPRNDRDRRNWWDRTSDEVASWFGADDSEHEYRRDNRANHRGKGPKGYRRSDEKIKSDVEDDLYNDSYIDASDMEVSVKNAVVTLSGSVDSKWIKRRAEDIAETVTGVEEVKDNLLVRKDTQQDSKDYYSNSDSGSRATSGTGDMTANTSHKNSLPSKVK